MTAQQVDPFIELTFNPEVLGSARYLESVQRNPDVVLSRGLEAYRAFVIKQTREKLINSPQLLDDGKKLRIFLDFLWVQFVPGFKKITGPMMAHEYAVAMQQVRSHQVNPKIINALAEAHAERIGKYFNDSSNDALVQGFNTYVNRKVPERAALERALVAYGLSPRQMSGLTSMKEAEKINASIPLNLKAKIQTYIGTSIKRRFKIFAEQEMFNIKAQAAQVAWSYMVQNGELNPNAEKVWITAHDEKVCPVCGPLHGRVVPVTEQFRTSSGERIWVPGIHPNCRCEVRLREPLVTHEQPKSPVSKAGISYIDWNPREHPRESEGRFTFKPKTQLKPVIDIDDAFAQIVTEPEEISPNELEALFNASPSGSLKPVAKPMAAVAAVAPQAAMAAVAQFPTPLEVAQAVDAGDFDTLLDQLTLSRTLNEVAADVEQAYQMKPEIDAALAEKVDSGIKLDTAIWTFGQTRTEFLRNQSLAASPEQEGVFNPAFSSFGSPRGPDAFQEFTDEHVWFGGANAFDQVQMTAMADISRQVEATVQDIVEHSDITGERGEEAEVVVYDQQSGTRAFVPIDDLRAVVSMVAFDSTINGDDFQPISWVEDDAAQDSVPIHVDTDAERVKVKMGDLLGIDQEDFVRTAYVTDAVWDKPTPSGNEITNFVKNHGPYQTVETSDDPSLDYHGPSWLRAVVIKPKTSE